MPGGRRRPATVTELERSAAAAAARPAPAPPANEVEAMLRRRGFRPAPAPADLPFPEEPGAEATARLVRHMRHYAFRLFLRGAIQRPAGFTPGQATRYLDADRARAQAEELVALGLAERLPRRRYRLIRPARSFGGTLEWWVAHELRERLGFAVAAGLKFRAPGVGGDLDVVAVADGRLVYLELKSSPPRNIEEREARAFLARVRALRPDVSVFAVDTALRLGDKVVPLLRAAGGGAAPKRAGRELWALTPHLYAINASPDLIRNLQRAIALGLRALAPPAP